MPRFAYLPIVAITAHALAAGPATAEPESAPAPETAPAEAAAPARPPEPAPRWRPIAESDPLTFALSGWSLLLGVKPGPAPRWAFKVAAFSARLPEALAQLNPENAGFSVEIPLSYGLVAQRYFGEKRGGLFAGSLVAIQNTRYTLDDAPGEEAKVVGLVLGAQGGYQWFPARRLGLYFLPWLGLARAIDLKGEPVVGGVRYQEAALTPNVAVHVGYEF
jgi:hypothetical protein